MRGRARVAVLYGVCECANMYRPFVARISSISQYLSDTECFRIFCVECENGSNGFILMTVGRTSAIMLMSGLLIIVSTWTSMPMMVTSTTLTILLTVTVSVFWILCTSLTSFRHTLTVAVASVALHKRYNLSNTTNRTVFNSTEKSWVEHISQNTISSSMSLTPSCERYLCRHFVTELFIICLLTGSNQNWRNSTSTITMQDERGEVHSLAFVEQRNLWEKSHKTIRKKAMFWNSILRATSEVFQRRLCGRKCSPSFLRRQESRRDQYWRIQIT